MMKNKYILSPYLFTLALLFTFLVVSSEIAMAFMLLPIEEHFSTPSDMYITITLFLAIDIAMVIVFYQHCYEYWGIIVIGKDFLELKAPLRKNIRMEYSEIADVGIDHSMVSGTRQLWIFISKDVVPVKYTHRIARMPISEKSIRVQYRKDIYDSMICYFPSNLRKRMERASSVLRLFRIQR